MTLREKIAAIIHAGCANTSHVQADEVLAVVRDDVEPALETAYDLLGWTVLTNHGDALGAVQWFPRWRQYCFDPREATTFNAGCLRDLATFLGRVNREQRESCAAVRDE
jgi:hypothetical protein